MGETTARLQHGHAQHEQLAELASQHQAQEKGDQDAVAQALEEQNKDIAGTPKVGQGKDGQFPELQAPHLVLASPAGIQSSTPGSTHQHSGAHHAITSGGHTSVSSAKSFLATAENAIRLFSYKAGVKIISAASGIEFKAVEQGIDLLAKIKITASAERVHIEAEDDIVINGGGSSTTWKAGEITDATTGTWVVNAASHSMPGGKELPVAPLRFPQDVCLECLMKRAGQRSALVNKGS